MTGRRTAYTGGVAILGTGVCLPPRVLTNEDLAQRVDTNDAWITQRTGIKTRRIVEDGQTVRDLARDALSAALDNAGVEPGATVEDAEVKSFVEAFGRREWGRCPRPDEADVLEFLCERHIAQGELVDEQ